MPVCLFDMSKVMAHKGRFVVPSEIVDQESICMQCAQSDKMVDKFSFFTFSYMLNGKKFRLIVACLFSLFNTLCDKIMGELYCSHDKVEPLKLRSRLNL
jgi:hypothetical protein